MDCSGQALWPGKTLGDVRGRMPYCRLAAAGHIGGTGDDSLRKYACILIFQAESHLAQ